MKLRYAIRRLPQVVRMLLVAFTLLPTFAFAQAGGKKPNILVSQSLVVWAICEGRQCAR